MNCFRVYKFFMVIYLGSTAFLQAECFDECEPCEPISDAVCEERNFGKGGRCSPVTGYFSDHNPTVQGAWLPDEADWPGKLDDPWIEEVERWEMSHPY